MGSAHAFGNSFEQLHSLHPLTPSDVPFPASNGSGSLNTKRTSIVASRDYASHSPNLDKRDYRQMNEPLTHVVPHLKATLPTKGRHRLTGKVTCVDYLSHGDSRAGVTIHMKNVRSLSGRETMADRLKELITVEDSSVCSRIILVEDLCSESMEILGTAFELDSELFAVHLNRSGYDAEDYNETDAGAVEHISPWQRFRRRDLVPTCSSKSAVDGLAASSKETIEQRSRRDRWHVECNMA